MADYQIDNVDLQILEILSKNARTAYTEIAEKLIVSAGTIHVRMKKMEAAGIVKGTEIVVDPIKLGFDLTAFIGVFLDKGASYDDVIDQLNQIEEINSWTIKCHRIAAIARRSEGRPDNLGGWTPKGSKSIHLLRIDGPMYQRFAGLIYNHNAGLSHVVRVFAGDVFWRYRDVKTPCQRIFNI
ncbi:MAG: winged helix-turn-helix transcriptional regulator [Bacteroidota bacterium]